MHSFLSRVSGSMPWLDKSAETLHRLSEPLLGPKGPSDLKDFLYGTWLGHPLHPSITDVPVGAWTATTVLDLLGNERAADATLKIGVAGAIASAVTGVPQWFDLQEMEEPRRLGVLHAMLNTTALGLYLMSWRLRSQGNRGAGVGTALAGYGIAGFSAWIGGHLSFKLGIGVSNVAFQDAPKEWTDIANLDELPDGELTRIEMEDSPVVVLRDGEYVYAASATCTHVGGPLDEGERDGTCVTCPWHGSVFDLRDGRVVHGPATSTIQAYETQVENGTVQIRALPS